MPSAARIFALSVAVVAVTQASAQNIGCGLDSATAFTEPEAVADVAAREPGIVARTLVEPGDRVKAGDILVELDKTVTEAELRTAETRAAAGGRVAAAEAQLALSQRRLEELEKLEKSKAVRAFELMTARADVEIAEAQVQAATEDKREAVRAMEAVAARLALLDLRAPFDGVVDAVHRHPSELVGAGGDSRVVTMFKLDLLRADFFVPFGCVRPLRKGAAVSVRLVVQDRPLTARLHSLASAIDAPTGMRRVSVEIDNADYGILGGERLALSLPIGGLER